MLDRRAQVKVVVIAALVALGLGAAILLTARQRDRATAGTRKNPVVLVLSQPYGDAALAAELGAALSHGSGLTVRVRWMGSRPEAVAAAGWPGIDGGLLPLFDYLLARQEFGVEAALQLRRGGDGREGHGVLLVPDDSPVTAIDGLAGQRVAFVDRSSTTGYLLPARHLADHGVTVQPVFTGTHDASLGMLARREVSAAGTFAHARPGFRVLATLGSVPNEPIFFHPRLPRATRDRLIAAFEALAADPAGRALLGRMSEVTGVVAVDDGAYAPVIGMLAATQQRLVDVVPKGRRLVEQRRAPTPPPLGD